MARQSGPGMRNDGKLSPNVSKYSGDGSLWWCRGGGTGALIVTIMKPLIKWMSIDLYSLKAGIHYMIFAPIFHKFTV